MVRMCTGCSSVAGVENILTNCFSIRVGARCDTAERRSESFRRTPKWTVKGWTSKWTLDTFHWTLFTGNFILDTG